MGTILDLPGELTTIPDAGDLLVVRDISDMVNKDKRMRWDRVYEEGSWSPTLMGNVVAGSPTATINGAYCRFGKFCQLRASVSMTNKGGMSGAVRLSGLPFNAAGTQTIPVWNFSGFSTGVVNLSALLFTNTLTLYCATGATTDGAQPFLVTYMNNTAAFNISLSYSIS